MQLVNLIEGGERVQMSKRAGAIVTLDDLLDDIGVDAARWFLASRSHDTTIDLDLELARSQSQDNPVYYVQYAHARIASILRKAGEERVRAGAGGGPARELRAASTRRRARSSSGCSSSRRDRARRRSAARRTGSTTYAHETAQEFSAFYRDCRVVGAAEEGGDEDVRIAICVLTKRVLAQVARPARGRGAGVRCRVALVRLALVARSWLSLVVRRPRGGGRPLRPDEGAAGAGPGEVRPRLRAAARPGTRARNVLVLVPGTHGGAGGIMPVARDIVRRVPRTQVWIVDRREQAFEDTSVFASARPAARAGLLPRLQVPARWRARTRSSSPTGA